MAIPMLRGRDFSDADAPSSGLFVIVSQATAKKFWGDADPIGRTLHRPTVPDKPFTVVGVVGDVRSTSLNQESPALYYPAAFRVAPVMDVVVRATDAPYTILPSIRQKVHELDPEFALANIRTM